MDWVAIALKDVISNQRKIKKNQELILKRLDEFKDQLVQLGKRVDEQILVEFRTGMRCLLAGLNSDVETIRDREFDRARNIFSKLMNLNPNATTSGTSGEIENPYLICMGYWGSFEYFNLLGDHRNAMIHAFECTSKYPEIVSLELDLFPANLYSKDYAELWRRTLIQFEELSELYKESRAKNMKEKLAFYSKQALRVGAAGITGVAGGGIAALIGSLTFGVAGGAVGYAGFQAAKKVWESIDVDPPHIESVEDIEREIERLLTILTDIRPELIEECKRRKAELQNTTLKELKQITR